MSLIQRLFGPRRDARPMVEFYARIVAQARRGEFYRDLGVPDTIDGRFDMVTLHVFLVMHRLKGQGEEARDLAQRLFETMVDDFDVSLREMGVGDTGVGKRVKAMVRGVNGRIQAYDAALDADDDRPLEVALDNNLYGTVPQVDPAHLAAMAGYVRRSAGHLAAQGLDRILAGEVAFAPIPCTQAVGGAAG